MASADIRIKIDKRALERLAVLGGSVPRTMAKGVRQILIEAEKQVTVFGLTRGDLDARSGGLRGSWSTKGGKGFKAEGGSTMVVETSTGASGFLGSNHPAARIHNDGGIIRPVRSQLLAIPLKPALRPAGDPRWSTPRIVDGLQLRRSKKGNLFLAMDKAAHRRKQSAKVGPERARSDRRGTGRIPPLTKDTVPYFLLKESVTIRATHYVDKAYERTKPYAEPIMENVIAVDIVKALGANS